MAGIEQGARPATAHKIVQTVIATMRRPAQALDIAAILPAMVVVLVAVAAILPVMAAARVSAAAIRQTAAASRVVVVTRDWAAVEMGRLRSCHKSGHHLADLLRNWRIVAYYYTPEYILNISG